jgi:iron complex transport system substrate-binding protein
MKIFGTMRGLVLAVALLMGMLLTACGGAAPAAAPAAPAAEAPAATEAPAAEAPAATEAPAAEEPAASEEAAPEAAAEGGEVTITHAQGETTVAKNPSKVIVFDYSIIDTITQLGAGDSIVAIPQGASTPTFLAQYLEAPVQNAGTLFEPDYEKVNELQPELIIVAGRSAAVYPELAKIAPTIDLSINQKDFLTSFKFNVETLASIYGKEAEATEKLAAIDASIESVKAKASESGLTSLILMTSGGKVNAYGPGSRFGIIHDVLGVAPSTNADEITEATHGDAISYEFIQEKNPGILFVVDRDLATGGTTETPAATLLDNELVNATDAAKNGKIIYLDPAIWYVANSGLGTVAESISEVAAAFE